MLLSEHVLNKCAFWAHNLIYESQMHSTHGSPQNEER